MRSQWKNPVSYPAFTRRLKLMDLKQAIETPRAEYQVRKPKTTPIQDNIRRTETLRNERIAVLDFDQLAKLEKRPVKIYANRIIMPKPKQTIWKRFISLFK